jgi:biopolymer transport protein ExbD
MSLRTSREGVMSEINVTPMADILIVLLLIFMVVTTLVVHGISVALPAARNAHSDRAPQRINIAIDREEHTFLEEAPMDPVALGAEIRSRLESGAERTIILRADAEVPFGAVSRIFEICRQNGALDMALSTVPKAQS